MLDAIITYSICRANEERLIAVLVWIHDHDCITALFS